MRRIVNCLLSICLLMLVYGCMNKKDSQDIVWYVPNGTFENLDESELYKPIHNKITDELTKKLKGKNFDFNIVFKSYGDDLEIDSLNFIELLREKDKTADIVRFEKINYNEYFTLDDELKKDEFSSLLNIFPQQVQITQKINGNTYQVPKPSVLWSQPTYFINSSFMNDVNITSDFFEIKYIDIMNNLISILNKNTDLQEKYRIDPTMISLSEVNRNEYRSLTEISSNFFEGIVIRKNDKKIINIYEEPKLREQLKINQRIYLTNIDKHINQENVPNIIEISYDYPKEYTQNNSQQVRRIPAGDIYAAQSVGYGILKTSQHKNDALKALQFVYTDKDISNLLIYGIENEDYSIEENRAVTILPNRNMMPVGTMAELGNNLIAYSSSVEPLNKQELADKYNSQLPYDRINSFVPDLSDIKEKYTNINNIYWNAITKINNNYIENIDEFYELVNQQLYENGLQDIIDQLQEQFDYYMEATNET